MDRFWSFHIGPRVLVEFDSIPKELERRTKNEKFCCCKCGGKITVKPGHTFDHHGWKEPVVECRAYLKRQIADQDEIEILYLCALCYEPIQEQEQHEKNLAFEKRYGIPRP